MANFQRGGDDRGGKRDGGRDSRGGDRGGRGGFDNKRSFTGARRGDNNSQMHKATCGDCGKSCEVPFRPTGEKPVFCRDCFGAKKDPSNKYGSRDEGRADSRSYNNDVRETPVNTESKSSVMGSDVRSAIATINARIESLSFSIEKLNKIVESLNTKKEETKVEVKKEVAVKTVATKKVAAKKTVAKTIVKAPVKKVAAPAAKKAVTKTVAKVVKKVVAKKK
jgi:CxxC-x17-CxxC domain-containing protein